MATSQLILILADYKGFFGTKQRGSYYRGGIDLGKVNKVFTKFGYEVRVTGISRYNSEIMKQKPSLVLYTSSEDKAGLYKSFIEDVIHDIEERGVRVIPKYAYLKAHNNKVAMELLRERSDYKPIKTILSKVFGTLAELKENLDGFTFPVVIKSYAGSMSRGVFKADTQEELLKLAKRIARTRDTLHDAKEILREIKYHDRYIKESFYRKKFIVQNLISNLNNDWKVLVYGNKCFVLFRGNRSNDFRASGSGMFQFKKDIPLGILDYAFSVKEYFDVPHVSLDIGYDGEQYHLLEFQFLHFGTTTIEKAPFYFVKMTKEWEIIETKQDLEVVYTESIIEYIQR